MSKRVNAGNHCYGTIVCDLERRQVVTLLPDREIATVVLDLPCSGRGVCLRVVTRRLPDEGPAPLAEKLTVELSAYYTAGLRNELARNPAVALIATVHALAVETFYEGSGPVSCLKLRSCSMGLGMQAPGIEDSQAGVEIAKRHAAYEKKLPRDPAKLWAYIQALSEAERLELLAHCAALSVDAVHAKARPAFGMHHVQNPMDMRMGLV